MKTLDLGTITPPKHDSPKASNPPAQVVPLPEQNPKKLVDTLASSSRKKTKKPIANPPMPSKSIDPAPKNLQ
jgi:hypothetical protein